MNAELIKLLTKEYLRGLKLVGTLDKLGFDTCFYRPTLSAIIFEQMGLEVKSDDNKVFEIIDKYERKIIEMDFFEYVEGGLDRLANEMITELTHIK